MRGIGHALEGAQLAIRGDTSAVTAGLGVSFNSTFVALILSILLMYVVHEIQRAQERLVLDTELYVDDAVISNLQTSVTNESDARGRIMDADFATETANLTKAQVLQQAGQAMLSQANSSASGVLSLLKNL